MMRISKFCQIVALSMLSYVNMAGAQTSTAVTTMPLQLDKIEDTSDPSITVTTTPGKEQKITQKREQGVVTEVKVNSGGSTYYVKPNTPPGASLPGDTFGSANRGAQWQVLEFDLFKKKNSQQETIDNTPAPPEPASLR